MCFELDSNLRSLQMLYITLFAALFRFLEHGIDASLLERFLQAGQYWNGHQELVHTVRHLLYSVNKAPHSSSVMPRRYSAQISILHDSRSNGGHTLAVPFQKACVIFPRSG